VSYILEALRKSQQERDLGRVPTLDATAMFDEDTPEPRRSLWPMAAVGLAGLAMIVALYAAMRPPQPGALGLSGPTSAPMAGMDSDSRPQAALPQIAASSDAAVRHRPLVPPPAQDPYPAASARPMVPRLQPSIGPEPGDIPRFPPLVEPPPPKTLARSLAPSPPLAPPLAPLPPEPDPRVRFDDTGPIYHPDLSEEADLAPELELQRQLDAEAERYAVEDVAFPNDPPTPIPPDLIAEIEAFKREVTGQGGSGAPAKTAAKRTVADPKTLRLTPSQEAGLPAYLMSVHVYDADASRRFVLINGLKYREGAKTREGFTVEQIVADGAVLSYLGNPFYVPR
jgi:general secretion pathway protein B